MAYDIKSIDKRDVLLERLLKQTVRDNLLGWLKDFSVNYSLKEGSRIRTQIYTNKPILLSTYLDFNKTKYTVKRILQETEDDYDIQTLLNDKDTVIRINPIDKQEMWERGFKQQEVEIILDKKYSSDKLDNILRQLHESILVDIYNFNIDINEKIQKTYKLLLSVDKTCRDKGII